MSLFSIVQNAIPVPVPVRGAVTGRSPETPVAPPRPPAFTPVTAPQEAAAAPVRTPSGVLVPPAAVPSAFVAAPMVAMNAFPQQTAAAQQAPSLTPAATLPSPPVVVPAFREGGETNVGPYTPPSAPTSPSLPSDIGPGDADLYKVLYVKGLSEWHDMANVLREQGIDPESQLGTPEMYADSVARLGLAQQRQESSQAGSSSALAMQQLALEAQRLELQRKLGLMEEERQRKIAEVAAAQEKEKALQDWYKQQQLARQQQQNLELGAATQAQNAFLAAVGQADPSQGNLAFSPTLLYEWARSNASGRQPAQWYPTPQYPGLSLPAPTA